MLEAILVVCVVILIVTIGDNLKLAAIEQRLKELDHRLIVDSVVKR
jgi:hypothetical protein